MVMLNEVQTLSWSRLQSYLQCPRKFHYHYIEKRSHERTASSLVFGSALHHAIEQINESRLAFDCFPTVEAAVQSFKQSWEVESAGKTLHYSKSENADGLLMQAERMLTAYLEHESRRQESQIIAVEHEATFTLSADLPPFVTRLDRVELCDGDLIITDFKTSKSPYSEDKIREAWPQVIAYSAAAMPLLRELGAKRIVPQLLIITKAKTPKIQVVRPQASQADVDKLKVLASEVWKAIQSENWMPRESWMCKSCPFRDSCKGGGSYEVV